MTVASGEINLQKSKHDRTHVAKVKAAFHSWRNTFLLGPRRGSRVIKCNRFPRQKGGRGPRRSMRGPWKLGTRPRSF